MDIGDIVSNSVKYPSSDWTKVLILGIMFVIVFIGNVLSPYTFGISLILVLAWIPIAGYTFRILKSTFAGFDELPEFDEFGELIIDGIKVAIVSIVYLIIPAIVIGISVFSSITSLGNSGTITDPTAFIGLLGGTVIIGLVLAVIFGIFQIIAIANMALYEGELGAAFRFSEILERISMIGWENYIIWLIVMFILTIIGGFIIGIISIIPFIGIFIAALIAYPYLYMFYSRSLALLFASSEESEPVQENEPAPAE